MLGDNYKWAVLLAFGTDYKGHNWLKNKRRGRVLAVPLASLLECTHKGDFQQIRLDLRQKKNQI